MSLIFIVLEDDEIYTNIWNEKELKMRKRILNNLEIANYIYSRTKQDNIEIKEDVLLFLQKERNIEKAIIDSEREQEKEYWYKYLVKKIKM